MFQSFFLAGSPQNILTQVTRDPFRARAPQDDPTFTVHRVNALRERLQDQAVHHLISGIVHEEAPVPKTI